MNNNFDMKKYSSSNEELRRILKMIKVKHKRNIMYTKYLNSLLNETTDHFYTIIKNLDK